MQGTYFYLYLMLDLFSRKVVGWEVLEEENAEHASRVVSRASLAEGRDDVGDLAETGNCFVLQPSWCL